MQENYKLILRNLVWRLFRENFKYCYVCGSLNRLQRKSSHFVICNFNTCVAIQIVFSNTMHHNSNLGKEKLLKLIKLLYIGTSIESIVTSMQINCKTEKSYIEVLHLIAKEKYFNYIESVGGKDVVLE